MSAAGPRLETGRLLLRPWREADLAPFAAMNADPRVMRHFPAPLTRAGSDRLAARQQAQCEALGYGFLAVEERATGAFVGMVGLSRPGHDLPFSPCVEIGWRLAAPYWGRGYATEAARTTLAWGFGPLGLAEIVAFTVPANLPSRRVMERIGLVQDPAGDFDHPLLPDGHPLRRHVLYRGRPPPPQVKSY